MSIWTRKLFFFYSFGTVDNRIKLANDQSKHKSASIYILRLAAQSKVVYISISHDLSTHLGTIMRSTIVQWNNNKSCKASFFLVNIRRKPWHSNICHHMKLCNIAFPFNMHRWIIEFCVWNCLMKSNFLQLMKEVMKKLDFVAMQTSSIMGQINCVNAFFLCDSYQNSIPILQKRQLWEYNWNYWSSLVE